jgi:integrase/recombinase XerD
MIRIMQNEASFVTQFATQNKLVNLKTNFIIRKDVVTKNGSCPIYLHITGNSKRVTINLQLHVEKKYWNEKLQRANPIDQHHQDLNLVLEHILSKVSATKIKYRLNDQILTPEVLKDELIEGNHRVNFVAYIKYKIEQNKKLTVGTRRRYAAVANNLSNYKEGLLFTDITEKFIDKYRNQMYADGKEATTINSNIIAIKHYLKLAKKDGIKIQVDLDDIKGGKTTGNRTSLTPQEVRTLCRYYFDRKLDTERQLALGYFLFACMTGLRISDIQELKRTQLLSRDFAFKNFKTSKDQIIALNKMAKKILEFTPKLFESRLHANTINKYLKRIAKNNRIYKPLSFHVARHTFATNFLRMGGQVQHLQKLLAHSKLETTMIYVHILAEEANAEIHKLDDLFKDFGFDLDLE